ncbi:hypothetical protein EGH82_11605 [Vibrio ponticus]|uniref:KfrA N-terminal DNA-binding domain-containing protein n=1 Tax=Vibrio ponticus TaxID=265668 RepID=A0A3N3E061_9VIBR|nr:hypothetical protein [Vibrio ponticus]ROV59898.1 hypothetical protein EGH82_11605 [Vibrio ponticus]
MLTKDVSQELEQVIETLVQEGKEPTVALVKARLKTSIPMPALISTIKSWKNSQRIPKIEVSAESKPQPDRITELEAQVKDLQQRLAAIEAKLA